MGDDAGRISSSSPLSLRRSTTSTISAPLEVSRGTGRRPVESKKFSRRFRARLVVSGVCSGRRCDHTETPPSATHASMSATLAVTLPALHGPVANAGAVRGGVQTRARPRAARMSRAVLPVRTRATMGQRRPKFGRGLAVIVNASGEFDHSARVARLIRRWRAACPPFRAPCPGPALAPLRFAAPRIPKTSRIFRSRTNRPHSLTALPRSTHRSERVGTPHGRQRRRR